MSEREIGAASEFEDAFRRGLAEMRLDVSEDAFQAIVRHFDLVRRANEHLNLTAILNPTEAAAKHACDSLAALSVLDEQGARGRAADIGSGAGYPGVPLAVARPAWQWSLIEAKQKKAGFLERLGPELGLENLSVVPDRSESLAAGPPYRDAFDLTIGRAIASLGAVVEQLLPLTREGGLAVAMKGPDEAFEGAEEALAKMGAGAPRIVEYELPFGMGRRTLAIVPKSGATPDRFPRRPGMAAKRPLF